MPDSGLNRLVTADRALLVSSSGPPGVAGGLGTAVRFYALAFTLSWAIWGSAIVWSGLSDWEPLLIILGAYGPLVAAIVLARQSGGVTSWLRGVTGLRGRIRWILIGSLGIPLVIAIAHLVLYRIAGNPVTLSSDPPWYWAAAAAPVNIWLLFWLGSAVEEVGWQGVAVPALMERVHPLAATGLHGVVWGTWHLPLFLIDSWTGRDQSTLVLYGTTIALSPTMAWLTRSAAGGVLPAVFFHAATNHYTTLFTGSDDGAIFDPLLLRSFSAMFRLWPGRRHRGPAVSRAGSLLNWGPPTSKPRAWNPRMKRRA